MKSYPPQKRNVLGTLRDTLSEELPAVQARITALQSELQLLIEYESKLSFLASFVQASEHSEDHSDSNVT